MPYDLHTARAAFEARAWQEAFDGFQAATREEAPLDGADCERYAVSAFMLGRLQDYFGIRELEYRTRVAVGDVHGAARTAMWIGTQRLVSGQAATGSGWIARAARLVAQDDDDYPERGYVVLTEAFPAAIAGDMERAVRCLDDAVAIATRFSDDDLAALALHQKGLFLLQTGEVTAGTDALDEAMTYVWAETVSPMVSGIVYCGAITGCWRIYDIGRAREWTDAMSSWCQAQPQMRNFAGECRVRRAQLKELNGQWSAARADAAGVEEHIDPESAAAAAYVRGNLDRLEGRWGSADEAFAKAARLGLEPQPGLALLRLAQGSPQAAAAMIRRADAEILSAARRIELLVAETEILLAVDDTQGAEKAADELDDRAAALANPVVQALAAQARAMVDLRASEAQRVVGPLRSALHTWLRQSAPYQEARIRALLAQAYRALGDVESAKREQEHAEEIFATLGATPQPARPDSHATAEGPLTAREREVLRLVAEGLTNRAIAALLVLSERTVDRHVSNAFTKLGVNSRAAATAVALERHLL